MAVFEIVDESVEILTLVITAVSAYYIYRQRTTSYNDARNLILGVHVLFGGLIISEFVGSVLETQLALKQYAIIGTCLILLCVQLLTMLAWSVYLPTQKAGIRNLLGAIYVNRLNFVFFAAGTTYLALAAVYLIFAAPYSFHTAPFPSYEFDFSFLGLLFGALILFMGYTSTIFMSARRRSKLPGVKRALVVLPLIWIGIGIDLLIFNSVSMSSIPPNPAVDISPFGYLIAVLGLVATSTIFRREALLAGLFESKRTGVNEKISLPTPVSAPTASSVSSPSQMKSLEVPFSGRLGLKGESFSGRKYLLEVDPSSSYERIVSDFANELLQRGCAVFVITARGSPIYNTLRQGQASFYLLSSTVSYTMVSNVPTEVLVPQNDPAVLLDTLQKTLMTDPVSPIGLIFDNVSDFILTLHLETSYRFFKKVLESIESARVTALFLMTSGGHEQRETSLVKSLFANQLELGSRGLEARRLAGA